METIVYTENTYYIKNITTFSQYLLNLTGNYEDYKLITIMGEYHGKEILVNCNKDKPEKDIDTYVIEQAKNFKTKLILELGGRSHLEKIESINITKIINKLESSPIENIKNIETIYNDYRTKFLDPVFYFKLYNDINEVSTYPHSLILDKYIKPFFEKMNEYNDITLTRNLYSDYVVLLYKTYIYNLDQSFRKIILQIENWDTMPKQKVKFIDGNRLEIEDDIKIAILNNLRDLWAQVSDFYLLRELFKLDNTKQYIILIGQAHFFNIINYLDNIFLNMENYVLTKISNTKDIFIINKILFGKETNCIDSSNTAEIITEKEDITNKKIVNPKKIKKLKLFK